MLLLPPEVLPPEVLPPALVLDDVLPPGEPPELEELLGEELPALELASEVEPPVEPALGEADELEDLPPEPPGPADELLALAPPEDLPPGLELPPLEDPEAPPLSGPDALVLAQAPGPVATPNTRTK